MVLTAAQSARKIQDWDGTAGCRFGFSSASVRDPDL